MANLPRLLLLCLVTVLSSARLSAQAVFTNAIVGPNPSAANPFTSGQIAASALSVSGIGRGTGLTASSASDRYSASGWNSSSLDLNDYFTWALAPTTGHALSLTSFVYSGQASGSGPTSLSFRSSLDSFSAGIGTPVTSGATLSLSDAIFQDLTTPIEFRLYGWSASSSGGTFSVNDFSFNGTVSALSAVPEPSTYAAIAGLLALAAAMYRRQRQRSPAANPPPT